MYSRSNSLTLSIPTNNLHQEHFPYRVMARSTEPEIFTFERIPEQQTPPSNAPLRPRKRNTRVMYPAKVRKYLPPAEKNPAKRWLLALCLVVFLQIYTEEPCAETAVSSDGSAAEAVAFQDAAQFTQYQVLPFQSAEEQVWQLTDDAAEPHQLSRDCRGEQADGENHHQSRGEQINTTCPNLKAEMRLMQEQSTRNGYVVALLYPAVYHRLGSDN